MSTLRCCHADHGVAHCPRCPEGWFGEAVVACDMPKTCKFPFLDSYQKMFLWTHKEVYLAPHPVVGLVLQVGDAGKFLQALGFESLDPLFQSHQSTPTADGRPRSASDARIFRVPRVCSQEEVLSMHQI